MEDMIGYVPEYFQEKWDHQGYIDRAKAVLAEFEEGDDDPEGGVREPAGDSPDSPPAGESRLPGGSDDYLPSENRPDDSAGIEAVTPLTKISHIPSNGILVYDMVVPTYWPPVEWKPLRNALAGSRADEGSTN
jgi:hypothetical protein